MTTRSNDARPVPGSPFSAESIVRTDEDLTRVVRDIPDAYRIKGMFLQRLVARLPPDAWKSLQPQLRAPPRMGRYLPFIDYSQSDYHRLVLAAAGFVEPRTLPLAERVRRLAREDFHVFGDSVLGRVTMTLVGDAKAALLRTPEVYNAVSAGSWDAIRATPDGDSVVTLEFVNFHSNWAYQLGQIEGIVAHFGRRYSIALDVAELYYRFVVTLLP